MSAVRNYFSSRLGGGKLPIPRVVRSKGYRSKAPAMNDQHQVSSTSYSPQALKEAVRDGTLELRGNVNLAPNLPGLIAAMLHGARIIR